MYGTRSPIFLNSFRRANSQNGARRISRNTGSCDAQELLSQFTDMEEVLEVVSYQEIDRYRLLGTLKAFC
jgi:hypothetical protein